MSFIGRERELLALNRMYQEDRFQMFVLYGRRRVGKTTLLTEFIKDKSAIFYAAEQSNDRMNLRKFSETVFAFYGETSLEAFSSWENAFTYIHERQRGQRLVVVLDEFSYLARKNQGLLSQLQHLIDHRLKEGRLFLILCGSYMGFMEREVLGVKSPLFGRRTGQLHLKSLSYHTSLQFLSGFSPEEQLMLYGVCGGTPLYLLQLNSEENLEQNIKRCFLQVTSYLYEEPLLLLRQEVQEPGIYSAVIEAVAGGAVRVHEISTKIGEESAKCLKYMKTLCELGILYKETPYGEKESSRKSIYGISDFLFRFWYRYVFPNRSLLEMGAEDAVWKKRIEPDFPHYMGIVFEQICREYLQLQNSAGTLPILFTSIGRWWGTNPTTHAQEEIDLIAGDRDAYLIGECKWRSEPMDLPVLLSLQAKADAFRKNRSATWYVLFSRSGFTDRLIQWAERDSGVILIGLDELIRGVRVDG